MAGGRTAIEGGFRAGLDEFPVIIHIPQRESQHAVRGDPLRAVGCDPHEGIRGGTARTHDELPDSGGWVRQAVGILRIESFVSVMVTVQHDVGAGAVQKAPQVAQRKSLTTRARREAREVEVRQRAPSRAAEIQVVLKPLILCAARRSRRTGVERDDMPRPEVVAVESETGIACVAAEILKIGTAPGESYSWLPGLGRIRGLCLPH